MDLKIRRRKFIQSSAMLAALPLLGSRPLNAGDLDEPEDFKIKLSCNLYSFNAPLSAGDMTLEEVIDFCASMGFDAVDPTGYYFTGYPEPPEDDYVYEIKKRAFLLGLDISGTGVRNDFTLNDTAQRANQVAHVKRWIEVAAKLDAPAIRIFTGNSNIRESNAEEVFERVVEGIGECIEYGKQHGVIITLQNHNELLKTADDVLQLFNQIDTDWFGLNLDIGSLRTGDPYEEIRRLAPLAYTWQVKENVYRNGKEEETDLAKIVQIVKESGYRGYLPLETLGPGDPKVKISRLINQMREAMA